MPVVPAPHLRKHDPGAQGFWEYLDRLVASCQLVIDRPKGSSHPRYPDLLYPLDYGYLQGTRSMDKGGIDIWLGSLAPPLISGIICTIDLFKKDAEIKILLGCTQAEVRTIIELTNQDSMRAIFLPCS